MKSKTAESGKGRSLWLRQAVCLCLSLVLALGQLSPLALADEATVDGGQTVTDETYTAGPEGEVSDPAPTEPEGETPDPAPTEPEGEVPDPAPIEPEGEVPDPAPAGPEGEVPDPAPADPEEESPVSKPAGPNMITPPVLSAPEAAEPGAIPAPVADTPVYVLKEEEFKGHTAANHSDAHWTEVTEDFINSLGPGIEDSLLLPPGNYYLSGDVESTRHLTVQGAVNLCLNGHTLSYTSETTKDRFIRMILIEDQVLCKDKVSTFSLCDCGSGGKIDAGNAGICVDVDSFCIFNMYGGTLSANEGRYALYVAGTANETVFNDQKYETARANITGGSVTGIDAKAYALVKVGGTAEITAPSDDLPAIRMKLSDLKNTIVGVPVEISGTAQVGDIDVSLGIGEGSAKRIKLSLEDTPTVGTIRLADNTSSEKAFLSISGYTGDPLKIAPANEKVKLIKVVSDVTTVEKLQSADPAYVLAYLGNSLSGTVYLTPKHEHFDCGEATCPTHQNFSDTGTIETVNHSEKPDWMPWVDASCLPSKKGYYFLTKDVYMKWQGNSGTNLYDDGNGVVLCLNGHKITYDLGNSAGFALVLGGKRNHRETFTMCDCSADKSGTATLKEGRAAGWESSIFQIKNDATLNLYNCTLTGWGRGIFCGHEVSDLISEAVTGAVVNIDGCRFIDNEFTSIAVYGSKNFLSIRNSLISGNKGSGRYGAYTGGVSTSAKTIIADTKITGNSGGNGGLYAANDLTLENVEITDNESMKFTGIIKFEQSGGVYLGTDAKLTLKGKVQIQNNTTDGLQKNLYLHQLADDMVKIYDFKDLAAGSKIGITCADKTTPLVISRTAAGLDQATIESYFTADSPKYKVAYEDSVLKMKNSGVHAHDGVDAKFEELTEATLGTLGKNTGNYYYYLDGDITGKPVELTAAGAGTAKLESPNITICLNGHTVSQAISVGQGVTLTLCDCQEEHGKVTGSGVTVNGGTLNIEKGCEISGCGTGVLCKWGAVNMKDATISECTSDGVSIAGGAQFTMTNGTISGCGSGVSVDNGTFTMNSGTITGRGGLRGSGVSVSRSAKFELKDGQITACAAGVSVSGTFTMTGGLIGAKTETEAGNQTVAVYIAGGETNITGGAIKNNKGYGIQATDGKIKLENIILSNNARGEDIQFNSSSFRLTIGDGTQMINGDYMDWEMNYGHQHQILIEPLTTAGTTVTFRYSGDTSYGGVPWYRIPEPFAMNASNSDTTDYSQYLKVKLVAEDKPYHIEYRDSGYGYVYYFVEGDEASAGDGPKIITQPSAPTIYNGESPVGKNIKVEATSPDGKDLTYQWKYNTTDSTKGGTNVPDASGGKTPTCKIPDLAPGDYWFFCEVTDEKGTTVTNTVKITIPSGSGDPGEKPIVIPEGGQPTAPSLPDGESPVGKDLTVEATSPGGKELTYQWKYNTTGGTDSGTDVPDANGGKTPTCKIPDLAPGTYYFYCVITDSDGKTVITNVVTIVIPEKKGEVLQPGGSVTTDDGKTEVKRDEDGGTVTIDKDKTDGSGADTTITLPEDNKTGEVTVDKDTGDVTVPGGSTVKDGDGTGTGKPDVTIGEPGGTVTPGGDVKIPEGGTANVGGTTDGGGNTTGGTTITGGDGGTTVTPKEDGTVDVGEGGKVKTDPETPGSGGDKGGTEITLPNGGNVDPGNGGIVTPDKDEDGKQIAGVDTNGDGNVDTLIVLPGDGTDGGDKITPNENGGVDIPGGTEIKGGDGGASVTLPDGGEVTPGGGVKPEGGKATTGEDKDGDGQPDIEVTLPEGGEIKGGGEGGLTVPGGTTVSTGKGENKTEIEIGGGAGGTDNGGTINKDGGVDLPEGGSASVNNGQDKDGQEKPKTEITAGQGGGTVKPNPDGTTDVSGGSTIKTGEDGTEVIVGDNDGKGGTVDKDGGITLPGGGSAAITDEDGKQTTITVPEGEGGGPGGTVKPGTGGSVEVPDGSKVKTETPDGGSGGDQESTEITLPNGGEVSEGGSVKPGKDDGGKQIAGVDTDGDGKVDTIVVLPGKDSGNPDGDTLKPNDQGGVDVPKGTEVSSGSEGNQGGDKIVIGEQGGSLDKDGGVDLPGGGTATITGGDGSTPQNPDKTITAGENGGNVKPNPDGSTDVSGQGTTVQVGGDGSDNKKPPVTVDDKGGTVTPEGNIEIKDGASVTVGGGDGKPGTTITAPENKTDGEGVTTPGSTTVTPKDDGSVDVGEGGKVTTGGQNGEDGTPVTLPSGGNVNPDKGGTIKPNDNMIATGEDKDGDGVPDTIIILPEGKGEITPDDKGGITLPGGSTIQSGSDDGGVSVTLPDGAELNPDGSVKPSGGGSLTVKGEEGQPDTTIKLPEGGAVNGDGQGGLVVPEGTEVKKDGENTPTVVVGGNGGSVGKDGNVNLPEGGSAVISDGRDSVEVKTPEGGQVNTADGSTTAPVVEINGITITAPEGETVKTDKGGTSTVVNGTTVSKGGVDVVIESGAPVTVSKDGVITFPNGGTIQITKDGHTTTKTIAPGGTVNINNLGGNGGGSSGGNQNNGSGGGGSHSSGSGSSAGGINVSVGKTSGGKVTISPTRPAAGQTVTIQVTPNNGYELDKLTVTDSSGKNVKLTQVSDSKYTFVMPDGKVTITPSFVEQKGGQAGSSGQTFTDVAADAWYAEYVAYVAAKGMMGGYADGRFGPNDLTTRAQVVTILYRAEGEPPAGASSFEDVPEGRYYTKAVAWAAANGIVKGYTDTLFMPERNITREQMAAIFYRYAQFKGLDTSARADLSVFTDSSKVNSYAVPAMQWAVGSGLIQGRADKTLDPAGNATRAQVAAILTRFFSGNT